MKNLKPTPTPLAAAQYKTEQAIRLLREAATDIHKAAKERKREGGGDE